MYYYYRRERERARARLSRNMIQVITLNKRNIGRGRKKHDTGDQLEIFKNAYLRKKDDKGDRKKSDKGDRVGPKQKVIKVIGRKNKKT